VSVQRTLTRAKPSRSPVVVTSVYATVAGARQMSSAVADMNPRMLFT
jgi:hypothetical protein